MNARTRQQPDAQQALATRREAGGTDSGRRDMVKEIEKLQPEFQRAMPRGREAVQLVRDALTCLRTVSRLAECQPESVYGALMTCAQLGLRPNVPALGSAYLIPFWNGKEKVRQAQLVIGYQGIIDLAMRSDRLDSVIARTVFADDVWDVDYGLNDRLVHKPAMFREGYVEDPEKEPESIAYYSIAKYRGGGYAFFVMSKQQVDRHRRRYSKQPDAGPWVSEFDAMGMKTTVRMLSKFMPKSTEFDLLSRGLQVDEGVRINYSANADPTEVTQSTFTGAVVDGTVVEDEQETGGQDRGAGNGAPPATEDWPAVAKPAGGAS